MATKDFIFNIPDLSTRLPITVKEWSSCPDQLFVRKLSAKEKAVYEQDLRAYIDNKNPHFKVQTVIKILVDKDGKNIFDTSDINTLLEKSGEAIDSIIEQWSSWNIDEDELKKT